jgi:energy-coupling factor transporter ATP-binding protein EcfA2
MFFDFGSYRALRSELAFGSAVDPWSGKPDDTEFIQVTYQSDDGRQLTVADLSSLVATGRRIILIGEFGSGKSRALREVFHTLARDAETTGRYPLAINLRENWGTRRGHEIIRRHFDEIGMENRADAIVRILDKDSLILLLDGFDEIGTQSWSDDPSRLKDIRRSAVAGIKDLLRRSRGGAVISGREHYFNSDAEMLTALGLEPGECTVVRCANEFTFEEMKSLVKNIPGDIAVPAWLPRRPLLCQVIARMEAEELEIIFGAEGGDATLWETLIDVICSREARISSALDAGKIKDVLRQVSRITRTKNANVGPVSISEINRAFEAVIGVPPVDESATMLQRLPGLGRFAAETTDRQFVDMFILDGLRGLDDAEIIRTNEVGIEKEPWVNPLGDLGLQVLADHIPQGVEGARQAIRKARTSTTNQNRVLAADIVSCLCARSEDGDILDFGGLWVADTYFGRLDMTRCVTNDLKISESDIIELDLPKRPPGRTEILDCQIGTVRGVSSSSGIPSWIQATIGTFDAISTVAQIRAAALSPSQQILVTIVKKTFFQKGSGKKEEALLRGLGRVADRGKANRIINLLKAEHVLDDFPGNEGVVYTPNRAAGKRMKDLMAALTLSSDPIWKRVSAMDGE